jgi:2-keto-3-deoxy-L-rhamnonate aldolase RhmA
MQTPQNGFKAAIKAGRPQVGLRSQACSPLVAEIIGTAGYHFIYFDLEHAPADTMQIYLQLQALAGTPAHAVIKLPINDPVLMQRMVDMGALNYVVPMVQSAEDAKRAIKICKYPPAGVRGAAGVVRANRFGDYTDYFERANDEICMIMQIETREALGKIEEIAAVDGVDAIFFGPGDIAADFGYLGNSAHPEVREAITNGIKKMHAVKKITGMSASDVDAEHWFSLGCRFVTVGGDMGLLAKHTRALAAKFQNVK